jgi:enoyl-CoA hydratase
MADGSGRVGLPELHVGVPFPTLVLEILRATVAPHRLQELLLVGGTQQPGPALAAGLIDEVVAPDALRDAAVATAERLGSLSAAAYATTKRKLRASALAAWRAGAADGDAAIVAQWCDPATLDAIRAFVARTLRA